MEGSGSVEFNSCLRVIEYSAECVNAYLYSSETDRGLCLQKGCGLTVALQVHLHRFASVCLSMQMLC